MTRAPLDDARRWCRDLGGPEVDLWKLPPAAVQRAADRDLSIEDAVRDVVSGWLIGRFDDPSARDRWLGLWAPSVLRWCRWGAGRGVDADDAAQEVLARALAGAARLPHPDDAGRWLWGVAWRTLRELERRAWLRRWWSGETPDPASDAPSPQDDLERAERDAVVRSVLQTLSLDDRSILWWAYVEGESRSRIAERTGWPEGTVNRRLTSARAAFSAAATRRGLAPDGVGRGRVMGEER
jgi:RNA polymerase sigma factor (sigma-70 family)